MRILMVIDWNRGQGGAEAYMSWLASGLRDAGDEVRLLTSNAGSAGNGQADYVALGTGNVIAQTFLQIVNPFAMSVVRRAIREFRPDVAFVNMFAHHLSPAIFQAMGDLPVVLAVSDYKCICPIGSKLRPDGSICAVRAGHVCHEAECVSIPHWIRDRPRYAFIRSGVARAARIVACSAWLQNELRLNGIESECVQLPVPPPSPGYRYSRSKEPSVLYCGRLDIEKGVDVLLNAFADVLAAVPGCVLRIAGRGPERARLELLAKHLGLDQRVHFLGWLEPPEIERELSSAWCLAAPSLWAEPLGLVALEAVVRGVPVVASAQGGFAETVEEGVSGMLVPNGDADALAAAIIEVVTGRRFSSEIPAEVVHATVERYSVMHHVERMRGIFDTAIERPALI